MRILFTVCGRAGSKGFRNKNLKVLCGSPLVYYTLAVIRFYMESHAEDEVDIALNTDSKELVRLVTEAAWVNHLTVVDRKPSLAGDSVAKDEVIRDTYFFMKKQKQYDVVVDLDITSPLRTVEDIERVLEEYRSNDRYDLVFSVVEARRSPYFNMVEKKDGGRFGKICSSGFTARQQAPRVYEMNASIYAYRPAFLESEINRPITDYFCGISLMPDRLVLDIDSEEDFEMMGELLRIYRKRDGGLNRLCEWLEQHADSSAIQKSQE